MIAPTRRHRRGEAPTRVPWLLAHLGALGLSACTLLITFDPGELIENTPERCRDGVDNDENGLTDCAEPGCQVFDFCQERSEEACRDRVDNDENGLTDCDDPQCHIWPACNESLQGACGDGQDNNGDGLTDCADFTCAQDPLCCRHEVLLSADDLRPGVGACTVIECLEGTAGSGCNAFAAHRWESYGSPAPRVASQGQGFDPNRCEDCVTSGRCPPCRDAVLLSTDPVQLAPGLEVSAELRVSHGPQDRAGLALTWQARVDESGPCTSREPVLDRVVGIALETTEATPLSYRVKAVVDGQVEREVAWARSEVIAILRVDAEGFAQIYLEDDSARFPGQDAVPWHRSLRPLPAHESPLRIAIHGNGAGLRVTDLRVRDVARCADPVPVAMPGLGFGEVFSAGKLGDAHSPPDPDAWDAEVVADPVVVDWQGTLHLFYTGRSRPEAPGAIGHAIWGGDAVGFVRSGLSPLVDGEWLRDVAIGALHGDLDLSAPAALLREEDDALLLYVSVAERHRGTIQRTWVSGVHLTSDLAPQPIYRTTDGPLAALTHELLSPDTSVKGSWEMGVSQPAVARRGPGDLVMLYTGRADPADPFTASIGLAVSSDGAHWQRDNVQPQGDPTGVNRPVLAPPAQSLRQTGLFSAALAWDDTLGLLRVWYLHREGARFSLHHAVGSAGGRRFHPYPHNPVLRPGSATWCDDGYLDGPSVLWEPSGLLRLFYHGRSETRGHSICYAANSFGH